MIEPTLHFCLVFELFLLRASREYLILYRLQVIDYKILHCVSIPNLLLIERKASCEFIKLNCHTSLLVLFAVDR